MSQPMIRLDRVTKTFPGADRPAVRDLSLDVGRGEILTLVGPSGCGKTTTLRMINRLIEPTSGRIYLDGQDVTDTDPHRLRRSIGYVIQQVGLFPHRTVAENIATVPELLGWERERVDRRVEELVDLVGLDRELLDRYPGELSGGQQQRVGVARALAADPPVLLMDEPFGAVDPIVRGRLQDELLALQERLRKTIVFVTHDIDEAIRLGDRMCILNVGGVVEQVGSPREVLSAPASAFVAEFLGGERGLRRLGLIPIGEVELRRGPMVQRTATVDEARRVMAREGVDWVGVLDGDRIVGWVASGELPGTGTLEELETRPFLVTVDRSTSLRAALDAVVTSHTRVAVVVEQGRYVGLLDVDLIAEEITE
ncbi:MAG: ABC transporter [Acidimicrobiia bacterium]|nr:MAG: ABC transporter [Acidimicrobiia bacterium]